MIIYCVIYMELLSKEKEPMTINIWLDGLMIAEKWLQMGSDKLWGDKFYIWFWVVAGVHTL